MLTPRENYLRFFRNETCEWTPTSADIKMFRPVLIADNIARGFVDQQEPFKGSYGGKDIFGCDWVYEKEVGGSMEIGTLIDDIEDWEDTVSWPDLDRLDWEGCYQENKEYLNTDKILMTTIYTGFFERLIAFIGFEESAMALVDEDTQPTIHKLFNKLADLYIDMVTRMKKWFNVELVEIHDDWGTQRSPMFSVETHKEMVAPYIRKFVDGAHAQGVYIEQHSCGMIEPLIPNLIATGIDTWRGQPICDKKMLVETYGEKFKFGVEARPAGQIDNDGAIDLIKKVYEEWKGKNVWIAMMMPCTPEQKNLMGQYVREHGVI